jgi:hypothetical protein
MNKTMRKGGSIIIMIALIIMIVAPSATAQEIEIDNYKMTAAQSYCYNTQLYQQNANDRGAVYRLDMLAQAFSANGRISGLEAGMKARAKGLDCGSITFVNNVVDWKPVFRALP